MYFIGEESYCAVFQKGYPYNLLPQRVSDVWAVCGKPGRTFSAVLSLNGEDVLMLNLHCSNPAVDKTIVCKSPYDKLDGEFEQKSATRHREWLHMLLRRQPENSVVRKIQLEYQRCQERLIIVGDFNDASRLYINNDVWTSF